MELSRVSLMPLKRQSRDLPLYSVMWGHWARILTRKSTIALIMNFLTCRTMNNKILLPISHPVYDIFVIVGWTKIIPLISLTHLNIYIIPLRYLILKVQMFCLWLQNSTDLPVMFDFVLYTHNLFSDRRGSGEK